MSFFVIVVQLDCGSAWEVPSVVWETEGMSVGMQHATLFLGRYKLSVVAGEVGWKPRLGSPSKTLASPGERSRRRNALLYKVADESEIRRLASRGSRC